MGMVGYYRRFIPNAAGHLFHLFDALKGKPKTLEWMADCQKFFDATKAALAAATLLYYPQPGAPLALTTDASNIAIGGVLEQRGPQEWKPLAFWSAKLEPNQQQWPPYDRELLAAFKGTHHFRLWIEGRPFTLYTNHQSLVPLIHKKTDPQTLHQTYQLSCLAEYTTCQREGQLGGRRPLKAQRRSLTLTASVNCLRHLPKRWRRQLFHLMAIPLQLNRLSAVREQQHTPEALSQQPRPALTEKCKVRKSSLNLLRTEQHLQQRPRQLHLTSIASSTPLGIWGSIGTKSPHYSLLTQSFCSYAIMLNFKSINIGTRQIIVDTSNGPARPYITSPAGRTYSTSSTASAIQAWKGLVSTSQPKPSGLPCAKMSVNGPRSALHASKPK